MNDKERRIYQKFVRCQEFGTTHVTDFTNGSLAAQTRAALAAWLPKSTAGLVRGADAGVKLVTGRPMILRRSPDVLE